MLRAWASSEFWTSSEIASLRVVMTSVERRRRATDSGRGRIVGASEGIVGCGGELRRASGSCGNFLRFPCLVTRYSRSWLAPPGA